MTGEIGVLALTSPPQRRGAGARDAEPHDPTVGGIWLALDERRVLERGQDTGGRGPLDPFDRRKLARREGAVPLDARQRGSLRRGQAAAGLLA